MTTTERMAPRAGTALGHLLTPTGCLPAVYRLVSALRASGVRAGDRVLLLGENEPGYLIAVIALISLDASLVLADSQQTPAEIGAIATRANTRWALLGAGAEPARAALTAVLGGRRVLRHDEDRAGPPPAWPGPTISLDGPWRRRRDAAVLWSSGTTGTPKGVVRSGESLVGNTLATAATMAYRRDDVLLPLLPFSHQYGMSLVLLWWLTGCSLLVAPYRRLADALRAVDVYGATVVDASPPTYHALLELVERRPDLRAGLDDVRMWCVGGAPLPPPLGDRFARTFGLPLLDGYGLTEVGNVALATAGNPVGCGAPVPGVRVRISPERGPAGGGGVGEVLVHSPGLMEGYLDERGRLRPPVPGWLATGDLGYLDGAGNLHVLGRHRAVHRMGYTLYPESIQRQAEACGAPVCVVGVDDERRGSQLVLFVEDPKQRDSAYWRHRIDPLLARYERPNAIEVVHRLPVGPSGKVDRAGLTRLAEGRRGRAPGREELT